MALTGYCIYQCSSVGSLCPFWKGFILLFKGITRVMAGYFSALIVLLKVPHCGNVFNSFLLQQEKSQRCPHAFSFGGRDFPLSKPAAEAVSYGSAEPHTVAKFSVVAVEELTQQWSWSCCLTKLLISWLRAEILQ